MAKAKTLNEVLSTLSKADRETVQEAISNHVSNNLDMAGLVLWNDKPSRIEVQVGVTEDKIKNLKFKNGIASLVAELRISNITPSGAHCAYYAKDAYVNPYDDYVAKKEELGFKPMNPLKAMRDVTEQEEQLAQAS